MRSTAFFDRRASRRPPSAGAQLLVFLAGSFFTSDSFFAARFRSSKVSSTSGLLELLEAACRGSMRFRSAALDWISLLFGVRRRPPARTPILPLPRCTARQASLNTLAHAACPSSAWGRSLSSFRSPPPLAVGRRAYSPRACVGLDAFGDLDFALSGGQPRPCAHLAEVLRRTGFVP